MFATGGRDAVSGASGVMVELIAETAPSRHGTSDGGSYACREDWDGDQTDDEPLPKGSRPPPPPTTVGCCCAPRRGWPRDRAREERRARSHRRFDDSGGGGDRGKASSAALRESVDFTAR